MLGGDPEEICRRVEEMEAEAEKNIYSNIPAFSRFGFLQDTTPEEDLHNEIIKEIWRRYFSSLSRESASAILNAMGDLGKFSPCATIPDLVFNDSSFMDMWNQMNPDKEPLQRNGAAWFSV